MLGAAGASHLGYAGYRKAVEADMTAENVPMDDATLQDLQKGLDALNGPAYPTGADLVYGSRASEYTHGGMGDISERVRHQFDVLEMVSCEEGRLEGLHMALVQDKESGQKILAVCGMEPGHIWNDLDEVFNSLYFYAPTLPDQFDHLCREFDRLEAQHGEIDLVAGHSIGAMSAQLLSASGRVDVVAFASAGLHSRQISEVADYFDMSEDEVLQNMKTRCVSVPSSVYSALGQQVGRSYWTSSPLNVNVMDHGTYQMDEKVHNGDLQAHDNAALGALIPGALALCLSVGGLATKRRFFPKPPENENTL